MAVWITGRKKVHVKEVTSAEALGPGMVEECQAQRWPEQRQGQGASWARLMGFRLQGKKQ